VIFIPFSAFNNFWFLVIIHRRAGGHTYFEDICEDHY